MLVFLKRPHGYKAGLLLLFVAFLFYVIGFSSSYWTFYRLSLVSSTEGMNLSQPYFTMSISGHNGLWETCDTVDSWLGKYCTSVSKAEGHPGWVTAVQVLQCGGLIGLILALAYALVVNFIHRSPNINNRHLEIVVIVSCILGFLGSVVYAAESNGRDEILTHTLIDTYIDQVQTTIKQNALAWAYCLNLTGCLLGLASAVVVCAYNRIIPPLELPSVRMASTPSADHSHI